MVCRTNPSVAIITQGELVKLGVCRWAKRVCIHHTAYPVFGSSRSGHRSPSSQNTRIAGFAIEITWKISTQLERGVGFACPLRLRIDIQHQLPVYQRVLQGEPRVFVVREIKSFELAVVVVPVQLTHIQSKNTNGESQPLNVPKRQFGHPQEWLRTTTHGYRPTFRTPSN